MATCIVCTKNKAKRRIQIIKLKMVSDQHRRSKTSRFWCACACVCVMARPRTLQTSRLGNLQTLNHKTSTPQDLQTLKPRSLQTLKLFAPETLKLPKLGGLETSRSRNFDTLRLRDLEEMALSQGRLPTSSPRTGPGHSFGRGEPWPQNMLLRWIAVSVGSMWHGTCGFHAIAEPTYLCAGHLAQHCHA